MNKKKLFSNLMGTGLRLTIFASMVLMALVGTIIPAAAAPSPSPQAATVSIDLYAVAGTTSLPGLATLVTVWGYTTDGSAVTKPGGPVLGIDTMVINEGDTVSITLHNSLGEPTALLFQGQNMVPDLAGVGIGGSKLYTFTATKPGTFLYEAGLLPNAQHQVAMGLYGALVVRPAGYDALAPSAYGTAFDTEQVLVLSELDTALNSNPAAFDIRDYNPKYYLINGVAYPDTADIPVVAGDTVLLRYVNAGLQAHSMSTLGVSQAIVANDGHALNYSRNVVAETIATGQTLDTRVSIPGSATDSTQYPLYDASLFLRNNVGGGTFAGLGGMLAMLTVGTPPPSVDTTGPIATALGLSPNPSDRSSDVTVTATISDATTGNSNVAGAEFYVDTTAGSATMMTPDTTLDSATESFTGTIPQALLQILAAGDHTVYVRGHDMAGNWGSFEIIVLDVDSITPPVNTLHFSTSGQTNAGPSGVGADFGDIYSYDSGTATFTTITAINDLLTTVLPVDASVNIDGFSWMSDTNFYVSFASDTNVTGVGAVADEDVVHYFIDVTNSDTPTWELYFDGSAVGLASSNVDAISIDETTNTLYFSTSDSTLPAGAGDPLMDVGDDADIYSWVKDATSVAREFDATAEGWSGNNVDGLLFVSTDEFYLSYSPTSTPVTGLGIVQDEDVVHYYHDIATDITTWSIYFDGTAAGLTSFSLDVDAFNTP